MKTNYSRRDLYAHGEPLGDSATRRKLGGGYVCGGGGGGSSSSASTQTNQDNRVAVQDGIGLANSSGNTLAITDGGIVSRGLQTVDSGIAGALGTVGKAIDAVNLSDANNAQGFEQLLKTAESLWERGEGLIGQTQKAVADAYGQARNDSAGTIDNRTIIVLAVAGAAAFAFANRKG